MLKAVLILRQNAPNNDIDRAQAGC